MININLDEYKEIAADDFSPVETKTNETANADGVRRCAFSCEITDALIRAKFKEIEKDADGRKWIVWRASAACKADDADESPIMIAICKDEKIVVANNNIETDNFGQRAIASRIIDNAVYNALIKVFATEKNYTIYAGDLGRVDNPGAVDTRRGQSTGAPAISLADF